MKQFRAPQDIARENLGVKKMFDKPIGWPKRNRDEDMAYDEAIDDALCNMSDEDIYLSNNE